MSVRSPHFIGSILVPLMLVGVQAPSTQDMSPPPFVPGETLTYDVMWSIFPAGQVEVKLTKVEEETGFAYEAVTTAQATGLVALLFPVHNEFRSLFDPRALCSRRIWKWVNEGRRHREIHIAFDPLRRLAILDERDPTKPSARVKHAENDIPACVADVITAFYVVRQQPLSVGKDIVVPVNDGGKTYEITVEVQAREEIQTPLGAHPAFRTEPKIFGRLYKRKGRMRVWFSDDEQRLPLRIQTSVAVGTITGNLRSVTNSPPLGPQGQ